MIISFLLVFKFAILIRFSCWANASYESKTKKDKDENKIKGKLLEIITYVWLVCLDAKKQK